MPHGLQGRPGVISIGVAKKASRKVWHLIVLTGFLWRRVFKK
jgi:hypothetical protein